MLSKFFVLTLSLATVCSMEQTISGGSQEEQAPVMVPNADWAREPHDDPGTLIDGRIKTKNDGPEDATGGMTGMTGMTGSETGSGFATGSDGFNKHDPQQTSKEDCADCGTGQDKVEDDGSKRPIVADAHVVMHTNYNVTGDYEGKGTLAAPGEISSEKCCRVCPPASECEDKDDCFHKCKRVCGPTCEIDAPVAPCAPKDEGCKTAGKPVPITPEMVKIISETPTDQKVAKIKALLRGAGKATPKAVPAGAVVVEDAVGQL